MQALTKTQIEFRLRRQDLAPIFERVQENGLSLFGYVASRIESAHITLTGMDLGLPEHLGYVRLTLTLLLAEAVKLHQAAQQAKLSSGDWMVALLAGGQLNVLPSREPLPKGP